MNYSRFQFLILKRSVISSVLFPSKRIIIDTHARKLFVDACNVKKKKKRKNSISVIDTWK